MALTQLRFRDKIASRKFYLANMIILTTLAILCVPVIINFISGTNIALVTGSEFVSLCIGIFGVYCGANVWEKIRNGKVINSPVSQDDEEESEEEEEEEEDKEGGKA